MEWNGTWTVFLPNKGGSALEFVLLETAARALNAGRPKADGEKAQQEEKKKTCKRRVVMIVTTEGMEVSPKPI